MKKRKQMIAMCMVAAMLATNPATIAYADELGVDLLVEEESAEDIVIPEEDAADVAYLAEISGRGIEDSLPEEDALDIIEDAEDDALALNADEGGKLTEGITWSISEDGTTLTISGSGAMPNSLLSYNTPWSEERSNITTIIIEDGVTTISNYAFSDYVNLESIVLPKSLTKIGSSVFYGCCSLKSIDLPEGITIIDDHTFEDCSSLSNIDLPESLTWIHERVFSGCSNLTSIKLPRNVKYIGSYIFDKCNKLEEVVLPYSVNTISGSAFSGCDNLKKVVFTGGRPSQTILKLFSNVTIRYDVNLDASVQYQRWHYTGKGVTVDPYVTVRANGLRLTLDRDYLLTYSNNVELGTATIMVDGINEYDGKTATATFSIVDHLWDLEYTVDKEPTCSEEGSKSIHCGECGVVKEGSEKPIKQRAHTWSEWTVTEEATLDQAGKKTRQCTVCDTKEEELIPKIQKREIVAYLADDSVTYTGTEIKPAVTVKATDGTDLIEGTDYTLSYANNTEVGTAVVTVTGIGAYEGGASVVTFTIVEKEPEPANPSEPVNPSTPSTPSDKPSTPGNQPSAGNTDVQTPAAEAVVTPFIKMNVGAGATIPLKVKQKSSAVKVTELAQGDSVVSWESSNAKVVTVNAAGKMTGKKAGTAVITVKTKLNASYSFKVKVQKKTVNTKKITVVSKKITLNKGEKFDLAAQLNPITSVQKLSYTTSKKGVAAVKKGVITAKKKGKAVITVKSGKKKVKIKVTVK